MTVTDWPVPRIPPSGTWIVWSWTVALTGFPAEVTAPSFIPPRRVAIVLSSSRSIGPPESFRSRIVVDALNARVPKFSEAFTSYVAVRAMVVALTDPGRRPGRAPAVIPRLAASPNTNSVARRGAFVEPGASEGAGVGASVGSGVGTAAWGGAATDAEGAIGATGPDVDDATAGTTRTAIRAMAAAIRPR